MPRLDVPAIVDALDDGVEDAPSRGPGDRFVAMIAEILGIGPGPGRSRLSTALLDSELLGPEVLADATVEELSVFLGLPDAASRKHLPTLRRFSRWLADRGGIEGLSEVSTSTIREELDGIRGLGTTTAEALLLFGLGLPAYPVDRATFRVFVRHGWLEPTSAIDEAHDLIVGSAEADPILLARLSRGLDRIGRIACRASAALCDRCPLSPWLPEGGPIGSDP